MSFRTVLIIFNLALVAGFLGFVAYRIISLRRNPEIKEPDNLTPFFADDVLEGAHLERALGVSLIALVVVVIGLLGYFIWEPFRGAEADEGFEKQSIERGEVLFANESSEHYDSNKSLLCANCHGTEGGGGTAAFVLKSEDPRCDPNQTVNQELADEQPYCLPSQVSWVAPSLQRAALIYDRAQLTQIITYGRPGTPMPAWGVASKKGALQEQSIEDLVNYVMSIAESSDEAQTESDEALADLRETVNDPETRAAADAWVESARLALEEAIAERDALPLSASAEERAEYDELVQQREEAVGVAEDWQETTRSASEGQVLFMANCARCHTRGWSSFDPSDPEANPAPGTMGGGAYGPNLTDGDVNNQFPPPNGESQLYSWISIGAKANEQYGLRGISSGRMPHFGAVLTKEQIEAIMAYERSL
jgi:mono/diheme cytochrome c family protein